MWLHVPSECFPSAPASADSTPPSDSLFLMLEQHAMWRSKRLSWRYWRLVWRKARWMPRQFGPTFTRSQATCSQAVSIWLSAAFPVSRGAPPEGGPGPMMTGISGPPPPESFAIYDRAGSSWRTSQASFWEGLAKSSVIWPKWGTLRNGAASKRPTLGRRTNGNGYSYWPTARADDDNRSPEAYRQMLNNRDGDRTVITSLTVAAKNWPTPNASDVKGERSQGPNGHDGPDLPLAALLWQTPAVADTMGGHLSRSGARRSELLLRGQAKQWATPQSGDGTHGASGQEIRGRNNGPDLPEQVTRFSRRDQPTLLDGEPILTPGGQAQLSAEFVEALMNVPPGWTDFAPLATASWFSKQRSRLASLLNGSALTGRRKERVK